MKSCYSLNERLSLGLGSCSSVSSLKFHPKLLGVLGFGVEVEQVTTERDSHTLDLGSSAQAPPVEVH